MALLSHGRIERAAAQEMLAVKTRFLFKYGMLALLLLATGGPVYALTLKAGEVIGSDGNIYQGASPQVKQNIINKAVASGEQSGVFGRSLFVVTGEDITFVPLNDLTGIAKEEVQTVVGDAVVATVTGIPELTLATVQAAQQIAASTNVPMGRALIEQAFAEASAAALLVDEDPLSAEESRLLLGKLIGPGLQNADQTPVSDEQIVDLLKAGDLDQLLVLTGLGDDVASAEDVDNALANLGDLGGMADTVNELTAAAWENISAEDLEDAIEYAADFAAQEAANVAQMLAADPAFAASPEGQALAAKYGLD